MTKEGEDFVKRTQALGAKIEAMKAEALALKGEAELLATDIIAFGERMKKERPDAPKEFFDAINGLQIVVTRLADGLTMQ